MRPSLPVQLAFSLRSAAEILEQTPWFVQQQIESGQLHAKKQGRQYHIPIQSLREWIDTRDDA